MGFESVFLLGLFMGLTHAFEADHVAAVATISSEQGVKPKALRYGLMWAFGHSLMIFVVYLSTLFINGSWVESLSYYAEIVVAVMLILLGAHIFYRLRKDRIHFHGHDHGDGVEHYHAHSHVGDKNHDESSHFHNHPSTLKALVVGSVHGLAGSAVFLIAMGAMISSVPSKLLFLLLFTIGTAVGMGVLSVIISIPFNLKNATMTSLYKNMRIGLASISILFGFFIIASNVTDIAY